MHLLNCLLLKLYKHCRRSHCLPKPNPSASFFLMRVRQRERAHKKFRGHRIDGMMLEAPLAPPSDVVRPDLKPVVVGRLLGKELQDQ